MCNRKSLLTLGLEHAWKQELWYLVWAIHFQAPWSVEDVTKTSVGTKYYIWTRIVYVSSWERLWVDKKLSLKPDIAYFKWPFCSWRVLGHGGPQLYIWNQIVLGSSPGFTTGVILITLQFSHLSGRGTLKTSPRTVVLGGVGIKAIGLIYLFCEIYFLWKLQEIMQERT